MSAYHSIPHLPSMFDPHNQHHVEYTISENSITAAEDVAACLINLKSPQNSQQQNNYAPLYQHSPALIGSLTVPTAVTKQQPIRDTSTRAAKTNSTTLRQSQQQQQQQRQRSSPVKAQSRKAKRIRVTANNTVLTPASDAMTASSTDMPHGIPSSLRYCAIAVCQKFRDTQQYTYNQLADSLINEFVINNPLLTGVGIAASPANSTSSHSDKENEAHMHAHSNRKPTPALKSETGALIANKATVDSESKKLRRRLYDTLNVLIAVDILRRLPDSKILVWQGYEMARQYMQSSQHQSSEEHSPVSPAAMSPQSQAEYNGLQLQAQQLRANLSQKRHALVDTTCRYVITQMLIQRNAVKRSGTLRIQTDGSDDHETIGFVTPSSRWQQGSNGTHDQHQTPQINEHTTTTLFQLEQDANTIPFPFLLCNASPAATLDICYNDEQSTVELRSDHPFSMNDDGSTLLLIAQALASQLNASFDSSIRPDVTSIGQEPLTILSSLYIQDRMRQTLPVDVCQYVDQHLHSAGNPVASSDGS